MLVVPKQALIAFRIRYLVFKEQYPPLADFYFITLFFKLKEVIIERYPLKTKQMSE